MTLKQQFSWIKLCELALAWGEGCISALAGDVTAHMCHLIQGLYRPVCECVFLWGPEYTFYWQSDNILTVPHELSLCQQDTFQR